MRLLKTLSYALVAAFLLAEATTALASGAIMAHVVQVRADKDGRGFVTFDSAIGGSPACVVAPYTNTLAFNMADAGGKAILAVALEAKATGAVVQAFGTGACNIYSAVMEDWSFGSVQ